MRPKYDHWVLHQRPATSINLTQISFKVSAYDSFLLQLHVKDLLAFGKFALEKICHNIIRKCIWEPCFAQLLHAEQNICQVGGEQEAYDGNPNYTHFEKHVVKSPKYI
jgi:hypothetical protein